MLVVHSSYIFLILFANCQSLSSLPDISKWNVNKVTSMLLPFYNCKSLSSLPDISKWDTKNVKCINGIFCGCNSLISLPDISKWKTQNLKELFSLFSDSDLILIIPDISKWNNYREDFVFESVNYNILNNFFKCIADIMYYQNSLEIPDTTNNIDMEFFRNQLLDKFIKYYV